MIYYILQQFNINYLFLELLIAKEYENKKEMRELKMFGEKILKFCKINS